MDEDFQSQEDAEDQIQGAMHHNPDLDHNDCFSLASADHQEMGKARV